jgi:hypothetical protein
MRLQAWVVTVLLCFSVTNPLLIFNKTLKKIELQVRYPIKVVENYDYLYTAYPDTE